MKTTILAIGKLRGSHAELYADYAKRMVPSVQLKELTAANQKAECAALLSFLPARATVVLLDERGKDLSSRDLALKLSNWQDEGTSDLFFVIGGADGFTDEVRARAAFTLGLGHKTWPHKLVRVMLIEQLYRAQQINNGHPYHRD
jgi:23S rRNA (pseudouridine1915-N3)-methyltransferase